MNKQILFFGQPRLFDRIENSFTELPEQSFYRLKTIESELKQYLGRTLHTLLLIDITTSNRKQISSFKQIKEEYPYLFIILLTNRARVTEATEAMKTWANDYIIKPFVPEEIRVVIQRNTQRQQTFIENLQFKSQLIPLDTFKEIVTDDPKMKEIFQLVQMVAQGLSASLKNETTGT